MFDEKKIVVLLAAYNGENYLYDQIRSILRQSIYNWTLLIRDDGSQDDTAKILGQFAASDKRIRVLDDDLGCLGATRNFGTLMTAAISEAADIVFFSDQDDVWAPDKMRKQVQSLDDLGSRYGRELPLLTYSDMEVVDEHLRPIHPSFMRYQRQQHEPESPIRVLLTQNIVAGCTLAINRSLLEFAIPIPNEVQLHDWWLAVCAAASGRIAYIDEPLVRYRQHPSNQIGVVGIPHLSTVFAARHRKRVVRTGEYMLGPVRQAAALRDRIKAHNRTLSTPILEVVDDFASCLEKGLLFRLRTAYRLCLRRQGLVRKLLLLWRLSLCGRRRFQERMQVVS